MPLDVLDRALTAVDGLKRRLGLDAPLDQSEWEEEKHPRGKGGKFAKKGQVSTNVSVPLHQHGFKIAQGEQAVYHSPGHSVAIHPVPEGKKFSSGWTHHHLESGELTHGSGGTALTAHLAKTLASAGAGGVKAPVGPPPGVTGSAYLGAEHNVTLNGKADAYDLGTLQTSPGVQQAATLFVDTEPTEKWVITDKNGSVLQQGKGQVELNKFAMTAKPAKSTKTAKPPPSFTHPNTNYQDAIQEYGLTPVKETATTQTYAVPGGGSLLVKTKTTGKWGGQHYSWKLAQPGKGEIAGKGINYLKQHLKAGKTQAEWEAAGAKPLVVPGVGAGQPAGKISFPGSEAGAYNGAITDAVKHDLGNDKQALVSTQGPLWKLTEQKPGAMYHSTLAYGAGQQSLNAALEQHAGMDIPKPSAGPVQAPPGLPYHGEQDGYDKFDAGMVQTSPDVQQKATLSIESGGSSWAFQNVNGKILKYGTGQAELNAAFEALHPRGAGGKFVAKPKQPGDAGYPNHPDMLVEHLLAYLGAAADPGNDEQLMAGPGGSLKYKIPGTDVEIAAINGDNPNFGVKKGGISQTSGTLKGAAALSDALAKLGIAPGAGQSTPVAPPKPPLSNTFGTKPAVDPTKLKKVGEQLGSNPGGQYEDPDTGQRFYVKNTKSPDHARNENLAARLYRLAGVNTLPYRTSTDPSTVVTEMVPLEKNNLSQLTPAERAMAAQQFAVHAWLANWDAVGATGDNVGVRSGHPTVLDTGGSLAYRAQGGPKGDLFGNQVTEWDTLRNPAKAPQAAKLYGSMTGTALQNSALALNGVSDQAIKDAVFGAGYTGQAGQALAEKLIARRNDVLKRAKEAGVKPAAPAPPPEPVYAPPNWPGAPSSTIAAMQKMTATLPTPTPAEQKAISSYTGGGYEAMNKALRFGLHTPDEKIKALTDFIDRCSLPEEVVVSRRVSNEYASFLLQHAKQGQEFVEFGFASTSVNHNTWSGNVKFEVRLPKGTRAAGVQSLSSHPGEQEVIVQRGTVWRVLSFDPKKKIIYAEADQSHLTKVEQL